MAKASKKRGKKKSVKPKSKKQKPSKRAPAKRKPAKRKPSKRTPPPQTEPWPMIFAVILALAVTLFAGWHFNGAAEAAEVVANLAAGTVADLRADTWLALAHPQLVPVAN